MKKSVFVLGAGASMPYGYPSGTQLIEAILNVDGTVDELLRSVGLVPSDWSELQKSLRFSSQPSIDAFLERRADFKDVGKLMIAANILLCEDESKLFRGGDDHWYPKLLSILDGPFEQLDFSQVTIVTFNYDRSIQQFLHQAFCHTHGKPDDEVATALRTLKVIHVHGQVGKLHWEGGRHYGVRPTPDELNAAARGIKIISECEDDTPELRDAWAALQDAEEVFCLGMAYHNENMKRLAFPIASNRKQGRVNGTAFEMTDVEKEECRRRFGVHEIGHRDHKCVPFLRNSRAFQQLRDA